MREKCIWQQSGFIFAPFMGELLQQMLFFFFLATHKNRGNCREWSLPPSPAVRKLSFLLLLLLLGCWTCNIDKAVNQKRGKENHQIASFCKAHAISFLVAKSFIFLKKWFFAFFIFSWSFFTSQKPTLSTFVSRYNAAAATPKLEKKGERNFFFCGFYSIFSRDFFPDTPTTKEKRE